MLRAVACSKGCHLFGKKAESLSPVVGRAAQKQNLTDKRWDWTRREAQERGKTAAFFIGWAVAIRMHNRGRPWRGK
jgi:hypothetical protein